MTSWFEEFWSVYPKKAGKKPCRDKWVKKKLDAIGARIVEDVKLRKQAHEPWLQGFVPNPLTYINQERWDDEVQHARRKNIRQSGAAVIAEGCAGAFEPD